MRPFLFQGEGAENLFCDSLIFGKICGFPQLFPQFFVSFNEQVPALAVFHGKYLLHFFIGLFAAYDYAVQLGLDACDSPAVAELVADEG